MEYSTLEQRVGAVLDRDENVPYPRVLQRHKLNPDQFFRAVVGIETFISYVDKELSDRLREISTNPERKRELFNMGEDFIREQYHRVSAGTQAYLPQGTLLHPENIKFLVYYALIYGNPKLASKNRAEVVQGIGNLPDNRRNYFRSLKLRGLLTKAKCDSPLAVLTMFDEVYKRKTGDSSIFDLAQKPHLHKWGSKFRAPQSFWKNPVNVEVAVYHTLTENNPRLASTDRELVKQEIKKLPTNHQKYFTSLEFGGLVVSLQSSPRAVLEAFDRAFVKTTGNKSLDLEFNSENRLVR